MLLLLGAVLLMAWLILSWAIHHAVTRLPVLEQLRSAPLTKWARVSIVIPARDEARHLASALASKRAQTYPNLEIVVVDDRSSDETWSIIAAAQQEDPRVRGV